MADKDQNIDNEAPDMMGITPDRWCCGSSTFDMSKDGNATPCSERPEYATYVRVFVGREAKLSDALLMMCARHKLSGEEQWA